MQTVPGKSIAQSILQKLTAEIQEKEIKPVLGIVLAGENEASEIYVRRKQKAAEQIGAQVELKRIAPDLASLNSAVSAFSEDQNIHGMIVQLPVPGLDASAALGKIALSKDVDGLNPMSLGNLLNGLPGFIPATPLAVMHALEYISGQESKSLREYLTGKHVVVVNRSILFGKPLAALLLNNDATVTLAHSKTANLAEHTLAADIIVSATGVPALINATNIKDGSVVIDGGFGRHEGKIHGDAAADLAGKAGWLSPVPGGIGPLGVAMLMQNTVKAAQGTW